MQAVNFAPQALTEPTGPSVWILEQPIVTTLVLIVVGVAMATMLARRQQTGLGAILGGALALLAITVLVLGTLIETDRERIRSATTEFIIAAVDGHPAGLDDLFLPTTKLAAGGQTIANDGGERIKALSEQQASAGAIESWRTSRMQATTQGKNTGMTQFRIRATPTGGPPTISWWKLYWHKDAEGVWRIATIDCIAVNGRQPGSGLLRWFRRSAI